MALYRSKSDGRNSIQMFSPEMDESVRIRRELESDLRNAIADGQLELHYQPLCNAPGSDESGVEALVRWNHPTKGLISPALFVPIAEPERPDLRAGRVGSGARFRGCAAFGRRSSPRSTFRPVS